MGAGRRGRRAVLGALVEVFDHRRWRRSISDLVEGTCAVLGHGLPFFQRWHLVAWAVDMRNWSSVARARSASSSVAARAWSANAEGRTLQVQKVVEDLILCSSDVLQLGRCFSASLESGLGL